ncbi:hypothetical protein K439DRAFT_157428 [Ramaria rubella]|nr:hypothetical protein K439DRAFT_157428 [Ramaria rubella]
MGKVMRGASVVVWFLLSEMRMTRVMAGRILRVLRERLLRQASGGGLVYCGRVEVDAGGRAWAVGRMLSTLARRSRARRRCVPCARPRSVSVRHARTLRRSGMEPSSDGDTLARTSGEYATRPREYV